MATTPTLPTPSTATDRCAQCGGALADGQEWCLRCGSAQTLLYRPPDWRVPVVVVLTVIVVAVAGFFFALSRLTGNAGQTAAADAASADATVTPAPQTSTAATAGSRARAGQTRTGQTSPGQTSTSQTTTTSAGIANWQVGLDGWTVVFKRYRTEAAADAQARRISPSVPRTGVLDSSDHPAMKPGFWVVFSGRYPNRAAAQAAVATLTGQGYSHLHAREVAPPGGI